MIHFLRYYRWGFLIPCLIPQAFIFHINGNWKISVEFVTGLFWTLDKIHHGLKNSSNHLDPRLILVSEKTGENIINFSHLAPTKFVA